MGVCVQIVFVSVSNLLSRRRIKGNTQCTNSICKILSEERSGSVRYCHLVMFPDIIYSNEICYIDKFAQLEKQAYCSKMLLHFHIRYSNRKKRDKVFIKILP